MEQLNKGDKTYCTTGINHKYTYCTMFNYVWYVTAHNLQNFRSREQKGLVSIVQIYFKLLTNSLETNRLLTHTLGTLVQMEKSCHPLDVIHASQRMNPTDFGDPLAFPLVPP